MTMTSAREAPISTPAAGMAVRRLTLSDFRCYGHLCVEVDHRPVVLTGTNGAGKTNVLEALSFLAPGRGMRRAAPAEIVYNGAGADASWAVAASVDGLEGPVEIGTGRNDATGKRIVRLDGQTARNQMALGEVVSILWLTPVMDRLFNEGASGRRRFLDRLVFGLDPAHAARLSAYEHALRERARLLRQARQGCRFDLVWMERLEEIMAVHGVEAAGARLTTIQRLSDACRIGVGPFPAAELRVSGSVEQKLEDGGSLEEVTASFRDTLRATRRTDGESGGAGNGPHRSDLRVRHAAKGLDAERCSTGEQKALLIAIVLGQARMQAALRGAAPILLLDEVAAHLDHERRAALFDELVGLRTQSWLTGTDLSLFTAFGERAQFFHVHDAHLSRQQAV